MIVTDDSSIFSFYLQIIYALFNGIFNDREKEMIARIKTFSASSISKLSLEDIEYVIAKIIRSNQVFHYHAYVKIEL